MQQAVEWQQNLRAKDIGTGQLTQGRVCGNHRAGDVYR